MPSKTDHLTLAQHNQDTIEFLGASHSDFSDWVATIAFYRALHLVESLFYQDPSIVHGCDHKTREAILKRRYSMIYVHYRPLKSASMIARYLMDSGGTAYRRFSDYLKPTEVKSELLEFRLKELEKLVQMLLVVKPSGSTGV